MAGSGTRVLVTGGAGFLGGHVVRGLCAAGHHVRVMDDFSTGDRLRLAGLPVDLLAADVRNAAAVERAMEGSQVVIHLAGLTTPLPGRGDLARAEEVNVLGTLRVLEAAATRRPARVVLISTGAVYGASSAHVLHEDAPLQPLTPDGVQRLAVENYGQVFHRALRVPVVTLRLFRCFGPGELWDGDGAPLVPQLCRAAIDGMPPRLHGDGSQTRDFLYVESAVAAIVKAAFTRGIDGRVYNVASGESVSLRQLWEQVVHLAGLERDPPPVDRVPAPAWEPTQVRVSIARARRDLDYAPSVQLRDGLQRTLEYYRQLVRANENGWFSPPDPAPRPMHPARPAARTESSTPRRLPPPPPLAARANGSGVRASAPSSAPRPQSAAAARAMAMKQSFSSPPATSSGTATATTPKAPAAPPPSSPPPAERASDVDVDDMDIEFEWAPVPSMIG